MSTPVQSFSFGQSLSGSVGTSGEDEVVPANTFKQFFIVQNTHATQSLKLSFTSPATAADINILPGQYSATLQFGNGNALYGLGSGAGTTFAVIGA